MADDGAVPRANVLMVLASVCEVLGVSMKSDDDAGILTLVKDGIPEVYPLPAEVGRRMLQRISGKYGVRIEFFYHPEMCCKGGESHQH